MQTNQVWLTKQLLFSPPESAPSQRRHFPFSQWRPLWKEKRTLAKDPTYRRQSNLEESLYTLQGINYGSISIVYTCCSDRVRPSTRRTTSIHDLQSAFMSACCFPCLPYDVTTVGAPISPHTVLHSEWRPERPSSQFHGLLFSLPLQWMDHQIRNEGALRIIVSSVQSKFAPKSS